MSAVESGSVPMEISASAPAQMGLGEIGDWGARLERLGVDVIHIPETIHDPFTIAAMALTHTTRVTVRTSMALAFPRSPMITAYAAWDLAKYSEGRFQLGIASQVRGNIVGRFSCSWSEPVSRLRDYIESLRAIFHSFQTGEALDHAGKFYRFNRLQPYFNPGPIDQPAPQIWTGGVNKKMCVLEEAGETLSDLARRSEWADMPKHVTDEIMNHVVPQGSYEEIPAVLADWYSGLCNGLCLPVPQDDEHDDQFAELVERCKAIPTAQEPAPF